MDNYNYPAGADTPDAPWNQSDPPEREFEVSISQSLSKSVKVVTNDYVEGEVFEDADHDDEGNWYTVHDQEAPDTSETDWLEAYSADHETIPSLLAELKNSKELEMARLQDKLTEELSTTDRLKIQKAVKKCQYWIQECEGWTVDETEVVED